MSNIHETAYIVNYYRSQDPELSLDPYAHLWVTERSKKLAQDFDEKVLHHEGPLTCLRSRYFILELQKFYKLHGGFTFINIGAGFTTYPFILSEEVQCIEVDQPHVVSEKADRLKAFQSNGLLPHREVEFIAADLNDLKDIERLETLLLSKKNQKPFFVLVEGVIYYLPETSAKRMMSMIQNVCPAKSRAGIISLMPEAIESRGIQRVIEYFHDHFGFPKKNYTTFSYDTFKSLESFHLIHHTDLQQLEIKYCGTQHANLDNSFDEQFYLLEKV